MRALTWWVAVRMGGEVQVNTIGHSQPLSSPVSWQ